MSIGGPPRPLERDLPAFTLVLANYNQGHLLRRSFERLDTALAPLRARPMFILVDDGSTDGTWEESRTLAASRTDVELLRQPRNLGRGRAVADGIRAATTELVATLDTDLEVSPHYLRPLLSAMEDPSLALAIARRTYPLPLGPSRAWELSRWVAHRGYRLVTRAAFGTTIDTASGCRVFRRSPLLPVLDRVRDERWFWDTELIVRALRAGLRVAEVPAHCAGKPPEKSTLRLLPEVAAHARAVLRLRAELSHYSSMHFATPRDWSHQPVDPGTHT